MSKRDDDFLFYKIFKWIHKKWKVQQFSIVGYGPTNSLKTKELELYKTEKIANFS